jgi:anti-sigma factor RsiW
MSLTCAQARELLVAADRGRLAPAESAALGAHLAGCRACAAAKQAERALTEALERDLPLHPASLSLKRRLAARWLPAEGAAPDGRARIRRWRWGLPAAAGATVALAAAVMLVLAGGGPRRELVVAEAVNDHLRLLDGERPLEVRSSDVHQVRPWFAGRVDFAPALTFDGDAEFELEGGAISRFLDRRAASMVFRRRQHRITLLVMPAPERRWAALFTAGAESARGFTVLLWRRGDLGYALVGDLPASDLMALQTRLTPAR